MPSILPDVIPSQYIHVQDSNARLIAQRCADLLPEQDRAVLRLVESSPPTSLRQLARLLNINPGTASRRVGRIQRRMHHPVVVSLATRGYTLSRRLFNIAQALYAAGQPARIVARKFDADDREILAISRYLEGWSKAAPRPAA